MKHSFYIIVFTLLGFLMNPTETYACVKSDVTTEKTCCSSKKETKSVCEHCSKKDSKEKSCDGSCNSSTCSVTPVFSSIFISFSYDFPLEMKRIRSKKANFFYLEKNTSLNYFAIWSPPKIG